MSEIDTRSAAIGKADELMRAALALLDEAGAGATLTACRLQHAIDTDEPMDLQHSRRELCVPAADIVFPDYGGRRSSRH